MQIDNFECEEAVIRRYTAIQLQHCYEDTREQVVARLPCQLFRFCSQIFKRQRQVNQYLFELFMHIFYLTDSEGIDQVAEDQLADLYRRVLVKGCSDRFVYLGQINVRFVLLGLSIKLMRRQREFFGRKLKGFVRKLQFELEFVLASKETLSDVILEQLRLIFPLFDQVQFLQVVRGTFRKLDVVRVANWADRCLTERRKKFDQKNKNTVPFASQHKIEVEKVENKSTKKRFTMREKEFDPKQIQKSINKAKQNEKDEKENQIRNNTVDKQHTVAKESRVKRIQTSAEREKRIQCLSMVNKRRSSMTHVPRFSTKLIFKSTKKTNVKQIFEYSEHSPELSQILSTHELPPEFPVKQPIAKGQDENSKFLCPATPPRKNLKKAN